MLRLSLLLTTVLAVGGVVAATADEVKVRILEDGTRMIYNENATQRARRTSDRLVSVPRDDLSESIDRHARARGLSPRLVRAVVQVESGYNHRALSSKGAMGLMQLMPDTARELLVTDAWDPEQNLAGGTLYLRRMLDRFSGDLTLALAAYNAGPSAVERYEGVPPYAETRRYVQKVLGLYRGAPPSDIYRDQAKLAAQERRWSRAREQSAPAGRSVHVSRDADGRIVVTTSPPR